MQSCAMAKKQVHIVGFSSPQRKRLANRQDIMNPVDLKRIRVKKAKNTDELEVVLKKAPQRY